MRLWIPLVFVVGLAMLPLGFRDAVRPATQRSAETNRPSVQFEGETEHSIVETLVLPIELLSSNESLAREPTHEFVYGDRASFHPHGEQVCASGCAASRHPTEELTRARFRRLLTEYATESIDEPGEAFETLLYFGRQADAWLARDGAGSLDLMRANALRYELKRANAQMSFRVGAWANYGLGSLNESLPEFVVMGTPLADCCGGQEAHRANYLGPQYDGVPLQVDPKNSMPYLSPEQGTFVEEQRQQLDLLRRLNQFTSSQNPDDEAITARTRAYELAFRMQMAVPRVVDIESETQQTQDAYGLNNEDTQEFGRQMLTARRLVESGVRFVQVYHGNNGGAGSWDAHRGLKAGHTRMCRQVDQPIGALLKDLKQRGLLDETLVVWGSEFGRTPGSQHGDGRDHHPYGFTVWMAGGGIKGGIAHGATDELGFHAVENRHYVTDVHATLLHQLGLDPRRLAVPGRQRLERDFGEPIREIIS
ncbi:MAG: hypothetical protein CMJ64_17055 [Planctomycetaceae bacterium]|nr:hypothetical protein [Planctomycetaceae bacterium]